MAGVRQSQEKAKLTTLDDLTKSLKQRKLVESLGKIKNFYLIMSGKGGVGKTTVAVNLALAKARLGFKVGLLDIDFHGPNVPTLLGQAKRKPDIGAGVLKPLELEEGALKFLSIQNLLDNPDEPLMWRGPKKMSAIKSFFSEVDWGELDYLLVDSPPGTGDELLTLAALEPRFRVLMVTTGHPAAISDAKKALHSLEKLRLNIWGLLENQAYLVCRECGRSLDLFPPESCRQLAQEFGLKLAARLPWDLQTSCFSDEAQVGLTAETSLALSLTELAKQL